MRQWWDGTGLAPRNITTRCSTVRDRPRIRCAGYERLVTSSSRQLTCPSMLCMYDIQDWLAMDEKLRLADADKERINVQYPCLTIGAGMRQ